MPKHLMSGGQLSGGGPASTPGLNGGAEDLRDLIEFSNISYQDVRQLIGKCRVGSRRLRQSSVVDPDSTGSLDPYPHSDSRSGSKRAKMTQKI